MCFVGTRDRKGEREDAVGGWGRRKRKREGKRVLWMRGIVRRT